MSLKIKGVGNNSENIFIKQVLFNDNTHTNTDLKKIIYKSSINDNGSDTWVRQYNIIPFTSSDYIDLSTVNVTVENLNPCTGLSSNSRNVIIGNEFIVSGPEAFAYYGDSVTFSAEAKKGYSAPEISNINASVSEDIYLENFITGKKIMVYIIPPEVEFINQLNPNTGNSTDGGPVRVRVTNNNSFDCTLQHSLKFRAEIATTIIVYDPIEVGAGQSVIVSLPEADGSTTNQYRYAPTFQYGFALTEEIENVEYAVPIYKTTTSYISPTTTVSIGGPDSLSETLTANSDIVTSSGLTWEWSCPDSDKIVITSLNTSQNETVRVSTNGKAKTDFAVNIIAIARSSAGIVEQLVKKVAVLKYSSGSGSSSGDSGSSSGDSGSSGNSGTGSSSGCVSYDTLILLPHNKYKIAKDIKMNDIICSYDSDHNLVESRVINVYRSDEINITYKIILENDEYIIVTDNHPILTKDGYKNIHGIEGYEKLSMQDIVLTTHGYFGITNIIEVCNRESVYNFYTEYDNFIANNIIVACENPDKFTIGKNCFIEYEGRGNSSANEDINGVGITPYTPYDPGAGTSTYGNNYVTYVKTCVAPDAEIFMGDRTTKHAEDISINDIVSSVDDKGNIVKSKVLNVYFSDACDHIYEILLESGFRLTLSGSHPILTKNGYKNIEGIFGYEKLDIKDKVYTINGYYSIIMITIHPNKDRVYNFYTEYDNFIANNIIVACENPDDFVEGVNCFKTPEGKTGKTSLPGIDPDIIIITDPGGGGINIGGNTTTLLN